MRSLTIDRESLDAAVVQRLFAALNQELDERYPEEGANHFRLDAAEILPGRGGLFMARLGDQPAGCAALRRITADTAEVKRMYVAPHLRGRGIGKRLLAHLEAEALALGVMRLVLETGERQFESVALYRSAGFEPIPRFGEYVDSPLSLCMAKTLAQDPGQPPD
jgi:putative acetyltransferase